MNGHHLIARCSETTVLVVQNDVSQPPSVSEHLQVAAEALRSAIHAVYDEPDNNSELVGEMYRAVGEASLIVDRLPELLRHLARRCTQLSDIDGLDTEYSTTESGQEAVLAAAAAIDAVALVIASNSSGRISPLSTAHSQLSTVKINTDLQ